MTPWLVEWPSRTAPMADLVCVPGAGAGASAFRSWSSALPPYVSLVAAQLPGREGRIEEPPAECIADVAEALAAALIARPTRPVVIFGHSMGAVIGFELARCLAARERPAGALVLAASAPPSGAAAPVEAHELEALLLAYDPENARITGDAELFAALGPVLAADIAMLRRHRVEGPPVATPAHLLMGAEDKVVAPGKASRWADHLAGPVGQQVLSGGHFFMFRESEAATLALLCRLTPGLLDD